MKNLAKNTLNIHFKNIDITWREENNNLHSFHKYFVINKDTHPNFHQTLLWPHHFLEPLAFTINISLHALEK